MGIKSPFDRPGDIGRMNLPTRDHLVALLRSGRREPDGVTVWAGNIAFTFDSTANNPISDLPGVRPADGPVHPDHWATNATPGTTNMRDAVALADSYALANDRHLIGRGVYAVDERVNLRSRRPQLHLSVLPGILDQGYTGRNQRFVARLSAASPRDHLAAEIKVDCNGVFGVMANAWNPASGAFPARVVLTPQDEDDVPVASAVAGQFYTTGEPNGPLAGAGFTSCGASANLSKIFFQASGPGTGTGTLTLRETRAVAADDLFIAIADGTVGGVAFEVGDRLRALVSNPSTSTYAGNWTLQEQFAAVLIEGSATAHSDVRVRVNDGDIAVQVMGNTERLKADISAMYCCTALREDADNAGNTTPDSNTYTIRGGSCAQWYVCAGSVVSDVHFNTQASYAEMWNVPCIHDFGGRYRAYRGIIRTAASQILIEGDGSTTSVDFSLHLQNPGNSLAVGGGGDKPRVKIGGVVATAGHISMKEPMTGIAVVSGVAMLDASIRNIQQGTILQVGDTAAGTTAQGQYRVSVNGANQVEWAIDAQRYAQGSVKYTGNVAPMRHSAGNNVQYDVPASMIANDVAWTLGSVNVSICFEGGGASIAQIRAYSTPYQGMWVAATSNGLKVPAMYTNLGTADGWQQPAREDLGVTS